MPGKIRTALCWNTEKIAALEAHAVKVTAALAEIIEEIRALEQEVYGGLYGDG